MNTNEIISNGVVLAFNCVAPEVDPNILPFWEQLSLELAKNNFFLIVASTVALKSDIVATIYYPYNLIDFHDKYFGIMPEGDSIFHQRADVIETFQKYYRCSKLTANHALKLAETFFYDLIKAVSPCAIVGWQSADITTAIVRQYAHILEIPFWCAERGLLKDTLMFDLSDNYRTSELNRSLALQRFFQQYSWSQEQYLELQRRYTQCSPQGKYSANALMTREALRDKYSIPEQAKVVVLFMHGTPGHFSASPHSQFSSIHELDPEFLKLSLKEICQYCEQHGIYLLFQDHPLNKYQPERISVEPGHYVRVVQENIHSLLRAGDHFLFTISTIQYEAVFYEKSIGLLSRSLISEDNQALCLFDYQNIDDFMTELLTGNTWPARQENLRRKICFIYDNLLIKVDEANRATEAGRVARTLSLFKKPATTTTMDNIKSFIEHWG